MKTILYHTYDIENRIYTRGITIYIPQEEIDVWYSIIGVTMKHLHERYNLCLISYVLCLNVRRMQPSKMPNILRLSSNFSQMNFLGIAIDMHLGKT